MMHPEFTPLFTYLNQVIELPDKDKQIVRQLFHMKAIEKNDFFLKEGQVCRQLGFITKGLMRYYINHNGEEKNYAFGQQIFER